jgi:hypothetical protein
MTWPNTQISTEHLDAGTDSPALARANLKSAVDNLNSVVAEFGNVTIASPATYQVFQYKNNQWQNQYPEISRYSEPVITAGSTGTVDIDFNLGNQHRITTTGNITLRFVNAPASATATVWITQGAGTANTVTLSNANVRYSSNIRTFSDTADSTDALIATTLDSGTNWYVSIVKGFVL